MKSLPCKALTATYTYDNAIGRREKLAILAGILVSDGSFSLSVRKRKLKNVGARGTCASP